MVSRTNGFQGSFETLESRVMLTGSLTSAAQNAIIYQANGTLDVAYYDSTAHNLKFSQQSVNGSWSTPTVIDGSSSDVGKYVTIALNSKGFPAVAYQDSANADLKFAQYNGSSWTVTTVDKRKTTGFNPSLAFDSSGNAYISYYKANTGDLDLATQKSGKWTLTTLVSAGNVGLYSSVAINPATGKPAVAYTNFSGKIQYIAKTGTTFSKPVLVGSVANIGTVSLAFSGSTAAVGYVDPTTGNVNLGQLSGKTFTSTTIATVPANSNIGAQVLIDPTTGKPDVVYHDTTGVYVADGAAQGSSFTVTQVGTGGQNTIAAVQPGSNSLVFSSVSTSGSTLTVNTTTTPPAAPSNVAAIGNSPTTATITWTDNSNNEAGFLIERSTDGVNFTTAGTTPPNKTNFTDTGLTEGTSYYYRVSAIGPAGNNITGTTVAATTLATTMTFPAPATAVTATATSASAVTVNWTNNSHLLTGFLINRSADGGVTWTQAGSVGAGATSFPDTGLAEGTAYTYAVIAYNSIGGDPSALAATETAPAAPSVVTANAASNTSITLTWQNNSASQNGFIIQRTTGNSPAVTTINVGANITGYTDNDLTEATVYNYTIYATGPNGTISAASPTVNAITNPLAPSHLTVVAQSSSRIDISWQNNSAGATGYILQRSINGGAYATIATISNSATTTWPDSGLSEGVNYSYQVESVDGASVSGFSAPISSTTLPAAPSSLTAAANGQSVTLTWHDNSSSETNFVIQRSSTGGAPWTTILAPSNSTSIATYVDNGVSKGLTYTYQVSAKNAAGTSSATGTQVVTIVPAAPTGLTQTSATSTTINLTWGTDPVGETGIYIERFDGVSWTHVTTTASSATSYQDTNLTPGTTYQYRISAINNGNAAGTSGYSTTTAVTAPAAPTINAPIIASTSEIDLSWPAVTGATSYTLTRTVNSVSSTVTGISTNAYNDTGLTEGTQYSYTVTAVDTGGSSTPSTAVSATTLPAAPTNVVASPITATTVSISWSNVSQGATSLAVQKSTSLSGPWTPVGSITLGQQSVIDYNANEGTTYYYEVVATDAGGSSTAISAPITTVPAAPTGLSATAAGDGSVTLNWTNNSQNASGYTIERGTDGANFPWTTTVSNTTNSYTDTSGNSATTYYYQVYATGTGGPSDYSNIANATTVPAVPQNVVATPVSATVVSLNWTSVPGATGYNILRSTDGSQFSQWDTSATNSYTDTGAVESTEYWYEVQSSNGVTSAASVSSSPVTTVPSAPGSVSVTSVTAGQVSLSWSNTSHAPATGYYIERFGGGGPSETFGPFSGSLTTYTDSAVSEGTTYTYNVVTEGAGGDSLPSAGVTANTNPAAPTSVVATENSATSVTITWNDVSANATGYDISRDGNVVQTVSGSTTSYTDTVDEDGSYQYQVRAIQLLGDNVTTITSPWVSAQPVTTPPALPTNVTATATDASDVVVTWTNNSPTATQFQVERFDGTTWTPFTPVTAISGTNTYTDTGAINGTQYTYAVSAIGPNGTTALVDASPVTTYPPVPTILTTSNAANPQIVITWGDVPGETGFNIERNDGSGWSSPIAVGQGVTTYTDTTSVEDVNYQYRVQSFNSSGMSAYSTAASVSTFLGAPTNVTITSTTSNEIDLSWTDNSTAATGYEVQSSDDGGSNWLSLTTTLSPTATSYQDMSVNDGTTYMYQVRALSTAGNSDFAQSASTTTPVIAPTGLTATTISTSQINLSWTNGSATANSFQIWRGIGDATPTLFDTASGTTYSDTSLTPGQTATYAIYAVNTTINATSAASTSATASTPPAAPTDLDVEPVSTTSLSLTWQDNSSGATDYQIYRDSGSGLAYYTDVTGANADSFTDTGLTEGTTYFYQVYANNAGGLSAPTDIAENTTDLAAPTNLTVTASSASSITLHWTDNSNNADGYAVELDGTPIQDSFNLSPNAVSYTVTGLSEATQYSFQVYAYGASGASDTTNTVTPTTLPAAPTLNSAVAEADGVHLSWTDNSANSDGFVVQRISNGGATTQNLNVASGVTSYIDTAATPNTQYTYQVLASGVGGNSAASTYSNVLTLPATPTNISASSTTSSSVTLTWTPDINGAAGGYTIERIGLSGTSSAGTAGSGASSFTDTGASAGATYTYEVIATNDGGSAVPLTSSSVSVLTAAPTGLTETAITANTISLQWNDVSGETGFVLQRSPDGVSDWQTLPAITSGQTTYTDSGLSEATPYYYQIAGSDASGTGDFSTVYSALTVPAAPTGLTATPVSATQVNLAWTDNSQAETGYYVYRTPANGSPTLLPGTLTAGTESYQDTTASPGVTYTYQVYAYNATGLSAAATQTAVTVPGQPQSLNAVSSTSTTMDLTWNTVVGATSYTVSRSPDGVSDWQQFTPVTGLSYHDTGLTEGTTYYYSVTASDSQGSGQAATINAPTVPAPVISLSISSSSATQVSLSWVDNSVGATGYNVYRETNNSGNFIIQDNILTPSTTTFSQTVTEGTTYTYRVTPVDASGEGAATDISITTIPATPTLSAATPASDTTVNLTWVNNSASATGFTVERAPDSSSTWTNLTPTPLDPSATSFSDTTASGGTEYQYKVIAQGVGGPSADSNIIEALTYASAVTTLYATPVSTTEIGLNWTAVNGATGYDILRGSTSSDLTQYDTAGASATSYTDTNQGSNLTEATQYFYQVIAIDTTGSSAAGNTVSATTLPLAPTDLTLTVAANNQIDLTWQNNSANQTDVGIEKLEGMSWVQIATTSNSTANTYQDSSLTGGTTYSYRVAAIDAGGSSYMSDVASVSALTFPDAPTLTATPATDGTMGLSWTTPTSATTYTVERSTGGGGWSAVVTADAGTSTTDSGLTGNTSYQYRILASNGSGDGAYSAPISILTVPDAPLSLTATAAGTSTMNLSWTGDSGANVKFTVYRALVTSGTAGAFSKIGSVTGSTTYADSGLSAGTTYEYEVFASNASGPNVTPAFSNQVATYPAAPASLAQNTISATEVDLSWTDSAGATSYTVSRMAAGDMGLTLLTTGSPLSSSATTYNDTAASGGTSYTYEVTATNASGSSSSTIAALTYPAAPTGLSVTVQDNHDIAVQWNAVTGATSYTLQRQINGGSWNNVSGVSGTSVTDVVAGGATYAYQVLATNATGSSAYATAGSVTTVPDAPTGVTATATSDQAVHITWSLSSGATGYIVERSETGAAPYTFSSSTLSSSTTSYDDSGLTEMTPYTYVVVAVDGGGNSAVSTAVPVVTLPTAPSSLQTTAITASEVDLSWTDNSNGLAGFDVQRNDGNGGGWVTLDTTAEGATTYQDDAVQPGTSYQYRVIADNGSVVSVPTSAMSVLTLPAAVADVTATDNGTTEIDLTWAADTGTVTAYRVMESTGGAYSEVGTDLDVDATSLAVTGLSAGTTYQFEVLAVNGTGASAASNGFVGKYFENTQTRPDLIASAPTFEQTDSTINIGSDSFDGTNGTGSVPGAPGGFGTQNFVAEWNGLVTPQYSEQYTFYPTSDDGIRVLVNGQVIGTDNFSTTRGAITDTDVVPYDFTAGQLYDVEIEYSQGGGGWDARLQWSSASQALQFVQPAGGAVSATTIPDAPTSFTATPADATTINLAWVDATGGTSYTIERQGPDDDGYQPLSGASDIAPGTQAYQDSTAQPGTSYSYEIVANDASGSSVAATDSALTVPGAVALNTPTIASDQQIDLSWTADTGTVDGYRVYVYNPNTTDFDLISGNLPNTATSYNPSGLTEATGYIYRVVAYNDTGESGNSDTGTLTTLPDAPTNFVATPADATTVNFTWTDTPGATSFTIEREGPNDDGYQPLSGASDIAPGTQAYQDSTAALGTSYSYEIVANDVSGSSDAATQTVLTVPSAVVLGTPTIVSDAEIDLTWTADTGTVDGYNVYVYNPNTTDFDLLTLTPLANTATSYNATGLTEGTNYTYEVLAYNGSGNSGNSDTNTLTTYLKAPDVASSDITNSSVTLTWTNHSAVDTGYEVDQLISGNWTDIDDDAAIDTDGTTGSFTVNSLTEATDYSFRVEAVGASSTTSIPQEIAVSTAPNDPTGITASPASATSVNIAWTNNSANADSVIIQRSPDGANTWTTLDTLAGDASSYTDTTATEATAYDYQVVATKGTSDSNFDTSTSVTTLPLAPTDLEPTVASATEIDLSWQDQSANATAYRVYSSSTQGSGYVQIGSDLSSTATSYQDTSAAENATTYYYVVAVDAGGESAETAATSATTPLAAPTTVSANTTSSVATGDKTIDLTWTNVSTVATGIDIERSSDGDTWTLLTSSPLAPSTTSYSDDTAAENTAYTYRVWAVDGEVSSTHASSNSVTTLLSRPTGLSLTSPTFSSVTLTWTDNSTAATSYHVERSTNGIAYSDTGAVLSGSATTYTDTGLSEGTLYYYRVIAETGSNASNYSAAQSITTIPAAPTTLTATPFSNTQIDLQWVDVSTTATQYTVEEFDGTNWNVVTSALNGSADSYNATGLIEATDHQYEVFATGAGGPSADSNTATATTIPLAPSTPTLTTNTASAVTIGWTNNSAGATSIEVQRQTSGVWGTLTSSLSAGTTSYTDSTVSEGTSYEYRIVAIRNGVDSANSSPLSVTTVPAAPSNLTITSSTSSRVSLSWTNNSSNETGFTIERTTDGGGLTTVATPASGATTFSDNTVTEGLSYTYYIYATNSGGNSANSSTVTANIPPARPTGLTATSVTPTSVALSWTNNSAQTTEFNVQSALNGSGTFATIATISGTTYTDNSVTEDNSYQYRVQAVGTAANSAFSTSISVNTPLLAPTSLTATTASAGEIDLSWTVNSQDAAGVLLERQTGGGSWTQFSLPAGTTSYQDTSASEATTYVYQVQNTATDSSVDSAFSATATATTLPAAPSGVTATAASDTQVSVSWTNNSSGATGFTIQRFTTGSGWVAAGSVNGSTTTFLDSGLTELTAYSYRVLATSAGGNSSWATSGSSVTTLPAAPSNFTISAPIASRISLTWTDNSLGATSYQVYRNANSAGWALLATLPSGTTSYNDNTVAEATPYQYRVRTVSNALNSVYTPTQSLTTVPAAPNTLAAVVASTTEIDLTWNDVSTGATAYLVERSDDQGTTWNQIASLSGTATSYSSSGLTEGSEYQYRVRAQGAGGYSGYSASVDATTLPATPSDLVATPSSGVIALTWVDNSNGETSYTVQRSTGGAWSTIASLPADSQSFNDVGAVGGLASSQNYQYQVFCTDDGGNSAVVSTSATAI